MRQSQDQTGSPSSAISTAWRLNKWLPGRVPAKFLKLHPKRELERLRKNHGFPTKATSWMLEAALTLYLALRKAPPRPMAEIRKELKELMGHFKRFSGELARLDFEIEWVLDAYKDEVNPETGERSFGPTANPHLALARQYLREFVDRAKGADLPKSKAGAPDGTAHAGSANSCKSSTGDQAECLEQRSGSACNGPIRSNPTGRRKAASTLE